MNLSLRNAQRLHRTKLSWQGIACHGHDNRRAASADFSRAPDVAKTNPKATPYRRLKTPDALHLATALHHGCRELWTNDDRLHKVASSLAINVLAER